MMGKLIRRTATAFTIIACTSSGLASGDDWRRLMTEGKLAADLGKHDEASTAFRAVSGDAEAPDSLRWEALVRFGLVRGAAGDPAGSAEAFRTVLARYSDDPEAMRFLTRAVASGVPGKVWIDFKEKFEELLRTARVVSVEELGPGIRSRKVTLTRGETELSAIWKPVSAPDTSPFPVSRRSEVAAYELDKVLGLDMVPPAVLRTLEGQEGALQLWVYGCQTHASVADRAPATRHWRRQLARMQAFDHLIGNEGRNDSTILVDASWDIVLIDHSRAFLEPGSSASLPERFDRRMIERLRRLTRSSLGARLEDMLTEAQIESLLKRRDALVAHVEKLVAERGEEAVLF